MSQKMMKDNSYLHSKLNFLDEIWVLACIFEAIILFTCKGKLKSFSHENNQRENNAAKPCLDLKMMFK